jgi:hypothetical protein
MNPYGKNTANKQKGTFLTNTRAFKDLFARSFGMNNVKFLAVNTDSPAVKHKVAEKIMQNPWPWAHVMAHDPKSGDTQFKEIEVEHNKPLLVITSNDGTIKYAGSAVGFLAPMMYSKVTGEEMNPAAVTDGTATKIKPASSGQASVANAIMGMFNKNKTPGRKPTATNTVAPQPKEMDSLEKAMAERDMRAAKTLMDFGTGFTGRKINPRKGVEKCRNILEKYPNTKYSEEARMLLRQVPERYRKRYRITNEEMGL